MPVELLIFSYSMKRLLRNGGMLLFDMILRTVFSIVIDLTPVANWIEKPQSLTERLPML